MASATPGKKATSRSAKKRFAFRTCANANQKPADSVKPKKRPPNSGSNANDFAKDGITDPSYLSQNFTQDDNRNARISDVCRRYVEHWPEMKADNIGILFYGGVGTGKSFLACCIANALIDKQVRASVTNFPES